MEVEVIEISDIGVSKEFEYIWIRCKTSRDQIVFRQYFDSDFPAVEYLKKHISPFIVEFQEEPSITPKHMPPNSPYRVVHNGLFKIKIL